MDRVARMYASYDRRQQPPEPIRDQAPKEPPAEEKPPVEKADQSRGLLDMLMQDKEQSLIMLLLVILMKDGADMNLLLALVYMLL